MTDERKTLRKDLMYVGDSCSFLLVVYRWLKADGSHTLTDEAIVNVNKT